MATATSPVIPNLTFSVRGEPKSGKTHFAMTFPEPIKLFSFDVGASFLRSKPQFSAKDIDVSEYYVPVVGIDDEGFSTFWQGKDGKSGLKKDIHDCLDPRLYKTVVIDTATTLWDIMKGAWGEIRGKKLMARDYAVPNSWFYQIVNRCRPQGINLVLIGYVADVWVNDQSTGEKKFSGFNQTEALADVCLQMTAEGKGAKAVNKATILAYRFDRTKSGVVLPDPTYADLISELGLDSPARA